MNGTRKEQRLPDLPQRGVDSLPLLALFGELRSTLRRDLIVFSTAATLRHFPPSLDVALPLETMQNRIEHAIRPGHVPA